MNNVEINDVGSFQPGEYGTIEVNGVAKCPGPFSAEELVVTGVLSSGGPARCDRGEVTGTFKCGGRMDAGEVDICGVTKVDGEAGVETLEVSGTLAVNGKLECSSLACSGCITVNGSADAKTVEVDGTMKVQGEMSAENITVDGVLKTAGPISADSVEVDGTLSAGGQVSADRVEVDGNIVAPEVVGDEIRIDTSVGHSFMAGVGFFLKGPGVHISIGDRGHDDLGKRSASRSQVGLIEATDIQLDGVEAQTVNGTHIVIGPNCIIENLDCNGTLSIDPGAQVKSITGNYTLES